MSINYPAIVVAAAFVLGGTAVQARTKNRGFEQVGTVLAVAIPAYALGDLYYHDDRDGLWQCGEEMVVTAVGTEGLKRVVHASRPNGGDHGFPSSHVTAAMSGASCIGLRDGFHDAWWLYLATGVVGASRVAAEKHDALQVLGSAGLSYLVSWYFVKPKLQTEARLMTGDSFSDALASAGEDSRAQLTIGPVVGRDDVGFGFAYDF